VTTPHSQTEAAALTPPLPLCDDKGKTKEVLI